MGSRGIYWYIVAPGIACHELGHCVGCWVTGNHVSKVDWFTPNNPDHLGAVWHSSSEGWKGAIESAVISTGPIWFGCVMIAILSKMLLGTASAIDINRYVEFSIAPGIIEYVLGCFRAAVEFFFGVTLDSVVSVWRIVAWTYLVFCISSEIGMSGVDMSHAKKGVIILVIGLSALSMLPFIGKWVVAIVCLLLPIVFVMHTVMVIGLIVGFLMWMVIKFIR